MPPHKIVSHFFVFDCSLGFEMRLVLDCAVWSSSKCLLQCISWRVGHLMLVRNCVVYITICPSIQSKSKYSQAECKQKKKDV